MTVSKKVSKTRAKKATKRKVKKVKEVKKFDLASIAKKLDSYDAKVVTANMTDEHKYIVPFKNIALNKITGGIPSGVLVEISGRSQSGKSYLLYELMAEAERMGGTSYLIDPEVAYRPAYGRKVGIKNPFIRSKENDIDKIFKDFRKFVKAVRETDSDCPIILGIDSFQNLTTAVDIKNEEAGKDPRGYQAMQKNATMSSNLKTFLKFIDEYDVIFAVLNPAKLDRSAPPPMFGLPRLTTQAEEVVGFHSTIRIQGRVKKPLKVEVPSSNSAGKTKKQIGAVSTWEVIKNRLVEPFKKADVEIIYKNGCKKYSGLYELLINEKKIKVGSRGKKKTDGTVGKAQEKGLVVLDAFVNLEHDNFYYKTKSLIDNYPKFALPEYSDDFFEGELSEEDLESDTGF